MMNTSTVLNSFTSFTILIIRLLQGVVAKKMKYPFPYDNIVN